MDKILRLWLGRNITEAMALAQASDILELHARESDAGEDTPAQHFIARFRCQTLVKQPADGQIVKADSADVGIHIPDHYLRQANAYEVLTWLAPVSVWHPNCRPPGVCVGERFFKPGTPLVELLYQLHALISWQKWAAHAPLNESAAQWARSHRELLPCDPRPLKRRTLQPQVTLNATQSKVSA